jgi:hypothetical protein
VAGTRMFASAIRTWLMSVLLSDSLRTAEGRRGSERAWLGAAVLRLLSSGRRLPTDSEIAPRLITG